MSHNIDALELRIIEPKAVAASLAKLNLKLAYMNQEFTEANQRS